MAKTYGDYASGDYLEYQQRYAATVRASDKVIIEIVRGILGEQDGRRARKSLVDIGCSSGNLLLHLKHQVPALDLSGGDAFPGIIERCRANPDLAGIDFREMDLLNLDRTRLFDIVVVNAVMFLFGDEDFDRAVANIAAVTRQGGRFLLFDFFHPVEQELTIVEKSETHPDGLALHFRPYTRVSAALERHGFGDISYRPFAIPIDLPRPVRPADITSHTVRTEGSERLIFRGALFTPWCHVVARRH